MGKSCDQPPKNCLGGQYIKWNTLIDTKKLPNKGELVTLATSNSWKLPIRFELLEIATKYAMKTAITMHVRVTFSMNSEHFWLIERSFLFDRGLVPPSMSYSVPFFVKFSTWNRYDHESPKCLFCCLLYYFRTRMIQIKPT